MMESLLNRTDDLQGGKDESLRVQLPMRVVLISQTGTMRTTWLPKTLEGRYKFLNENGMDDGLPFYLEAVNGEWKAYSGRSAVFYKMDPMTGEEIPLGQEASLTDRGLANLRYRGERYALYTEAEASGDYVFIPYYFEERTDYSIGRSDKNLICYPNPAVSRMHALLQWTENTWEIVDQQSTNGTYVNGRKIAPLRPEPLRLGDCIFIMGLYILVGPGFFAINDLNHRVEIKTPRVRHIGIRGERGERDVLYPDVPASRVNGLFDRPPHKRFMLEPQPITLDNPPMSMSGNNIPLMLRLGNPVVMGGRAIATGNYIMALTSLVFPALTQGLTEKDRKEYEARRLVEYRKYLAAKEDEIDSEKRAEERLLNEYYPNLRDALDFSTTQKRLWERRRSDEDFLRVRLGTGRIPLIAERTFSPRRFELEHDELTDEMYELAERPVMLEDVPVMVSLLEDYAVGVLGSAELGTALLKNVAMQLALTHSYDELKLILLVPAEAVGTFGFVRYLPHNWDNDREIRFFASSQSDAQEIGEFLSREMEPILHGSGKKQELKKIPSYIVLALSKELYDCVEVFKDILLQEEYCGVSIIAAFDGMPKECSKVIDLNSGYGTLLDLVHAETADIAFQLDDYEPARAYYSMRALMRTKLKIGAQAYSLPDMMTFLDMFGVGKVEHLNPLKRWADSNPIKSLAAPVGVGTDGKLFTLDLHEKRQGPHGLVAGMTGSGKSEFLITYILSMAVNYSPDEVAFILIDYKGGGLADAFENKEKGIHLPHLVGTITNLDGDSIQRSLMSIKSELLRRQSVFKEIKAQMGEGTLDIYDYQKLYRSRTVSEPMPHLFIVSDEFAELKQQQPMFMDELISAARIGRSLGVHLILATQKPGGVVNNQIWSNTKFRVCLRVQDRGDSMEMLKRPEAAELKHTGRFYLQVGYNEYFALGQSAWCGADYIPQDEVVEERDNAVRFVDNVGQTVLHIKPKTAKRRAEQKQIVAIVRYLSDLARRENIHPRNLWTAPLQNKFELGVLLEQTSQPDAITALIGVVDDPEKQCQYPLYIPLQNMHNMLLVGSSGSGKSTFIRTLLYSLVRCYSPARLNYYILDLSDGALNGFAHMPHCGAYLSDKESAELNRLFSLIRQIIAKRKTQFAEKGIAGFDTYCKIETIPLILLIVDGFSNVKNLPNGDSYFLTFQDLLREGAAFGVRVIVTSNHFNEVGLQARQDIDYRIALQAKDHYEYSDILGVRCKTTPSEVAGRGMCVIGGRPLAYQTAMLDCELEEKDRPAALRERLVRLANVYRDSVEANRLPMVDPKQPYEDFCAGFTPGRIPLGYSARDMKPVAIPFQQLHSLSYYFGNAKGVCPVFHNLLYAAEQNRMEVIAVRRAEGSVFDELGEENPLSALSSAATLLNSDAEGLSRLADRIMHEIEARNILRDEHSVLNGISLIAKGRAKRASKYIRSKSVPLLVLIESFSDFCKVEIDSDLQGKFIVFFSMMRGYNIYFAAGFYPDDEFSVNDPVMKSYNGEERILLSGGRYDKIAIKNIPYEITKFDKQDARYNQMLLKYADHFHPLFMPCGSIREKILDPDEAPII